MLDVPEGVELLGLTESLRKFCALVSSANIFDNLVDSVSNCTNCMKPPEVCVSI